MPSEDIPEPLRLFIAAHIHSIEELEMLIHLRSTTEREWTAAQISRELGASLSWSEERLGSLSTRGFVMVREADSAHLYRYAPSTQESRVRVEELAVTYKQRRLSVINLIYTRIDPEKPESDVILFSNAFRIGKKKGGF